MSMKVYSISFSPVLMSYINCIAMTPLVSPDTCHPYLKFYSLSLTDEKHACICYDFKASNYLALLKFLNSLNWKATHAQYFVDDSASIFNDALHNSMKQFIPCSRSPKFSCWVGESTLKSLLIQKKCANFLFKRSKPVVDYCKINLNS